MRKRLNEWIKDDRTNNYNNYYNVKKKKKNIFIEYENKQCKREVFEREST
jgi:hypothetical protein